jgi:hypothetical protein
MIAFKKNIIALFHYLRSYTQAQPRTHEPEERSWPVREENANHKNGHLIACEGKYKAVSGQKHPRLNLEWTRRAEIERVGRKRA